MRRALALLRVFLGRSRAGLYRSPAAGSNGAGHGHVEWLCHARSSRGPLWLPERMPRSLAVAGSAHDRRFGREPRSTALIEHLRLTALEAVPRGRRRNFDEYGKDGSLKLRRNRDCAYTVCGPLSADARSGLRFQLACMEN